MRPKIRLFVDEALGAGARIAADPAKAHYLQGVMRQRAGDRVALFNSRDGEWAATLVPEGKRRLVLAVEERLRPQADEPGPRLLFAPIKRTRLELLIEKATELGVGSLVPVRTRRAVVDRLNPTRLRAIAIEAAEQCGRLTIPEIAPLAPLEEAVSSRDVPILFADETGIGTPLLEAIRTQGPGDLLIGPEGGFDSAERAALMASPHLVPVSLGPRILRAETAALAALTLWHASFQENRRP